MEERNDRKRRWKGTVSGDGIDGTKQRGTAQWWEGSRKAEERKEG